MSKPQLEIACFNLESALIAQQNGADRIELCDGFEVGGTTPALSTTVQARAAVTIDLFVMIRPRGGNFVYSDSEFAQMQDSILQLKQANVDGFVFGILHADRSVNVVQNQQLVALAEPLPCTFHRAFDQVDDVSKSLEEIIGCGFKTVLTSGQCADVDAGAARLSELVKIAGDRIQIMPGGGLRAANVRQLQQTTKAWWYHSSAITQMGQIADAKEIQALKSYLTDH